MHEQRRANEATYTPALVLLGIATLVELSHPRFPEWPAC
jgi:hypothetical protein